jgi:hypothetical protein
MLLGKKNYFGYNWLDGFHPLSMVKNEKTGVMEPFKPKIDAKGIESKRRDKIPFVQIVLKEVMERMLKMEPCMKICEYMRAENEKLCKDEYDLWYTIQSKQIKVSYTMECVQTKILELQALYGLPVSVAGDRVEYGIKKTSGKNVKLLDAVEIPDVMIENNIPVDYKRVGEACVFNAQKRIIYLLILKEYCPDFKPEYLDHTDLKNGKKKQELPERCMEILNWIWEPFHIDYPLTDVEAGGALMKIAQREARCKVCGVALNSKNAKSGRAGIQILCDNHKDHIVSYRNTYITKITNWETEKKEVWDECNKCVGEFGDAAACVARSCQRFWRRKKIDKSLDGCTKTLQRINISDW